MKADADTLVAMLNLAWLVKNKRAEFYPDCDVVVVGDSGFKVDCLYDYHLTPGPAQHDARAFNDHIDFLDEDL